MRKPLLIVAGVLGALLIIVVGLVLYALLNLNGIIAANRGYLLARASDSLGRPVHAEEIKASVGWGVMMDVTGVKVADDPAFSQLPFVQASDVYVKVEFLPLLSRSLVVTSLLLNNPQVRILRNASGDLNVSTIGSKTGAGASPPAPGSREHLGGGAAQLAALTVDSLKITDGQIYYQDQKTGGAPVTVNELNLAIDNFSVRSPFDVALSIALASDTKNLEVSGKVGPLMNAGTIDANAVPLDLAATIGPLKLDSLKAIPQLARAIPPALSISDPVTLNTKITGMVGAIRFDTEGDLSNKHIAYAGALDKPAGVPLKLSASGSREGGNVAIRDANVTLAALALKATNISIANGAVAARLDSNQFDLGSLAHVLTIAQKYNPTGTAELHASVRTVSHQPPSLEGTLALNRVNASVPGGKTPPIGDLSGTIRFAGKGATAGPFAFNLGSGHAKLTIAAQTIQPLKATYQLSVDTLKVGELVPARQDLGEQLSNLAASGNISRNGSVMAVSANLSSASGMVANVPYTELSTTANYGGDRVTLASLRLNAFDGAIDASGVASVAGDHAFDLKLDAKNVDLQNALEAQKAKAAETIRGILTGQVRVTGAGANFDQIKPTLRGNGAASIHDGKLVGVNVVASALGKVDNLPGIGVLVPASVVNNHPELFKSPDTVLDQASLTFVLEGQRITSHDIDVRSPDYTILGDGWFAMDKSIDLAARILMSKEFSDELVASKRNVSYLTTGQGQVEIPLRISGQLPKPRVAPDVTVLAQRAAGHAIQNKIGELLSGKKGGRNLLGGFFGKGGGSGGGGGSNPQPTPNNPIDTLRGLFH